MYLLLASMSQAHCETDQKATAVYIVSCYVVRHARWSTTPRGFSVAQSLYGMPPPNLSPNVVRRQFVNRGYGVIYLGREGCAAPFARRLQELVSPHVDLDFMDKLVLGGKT